MTDLHFFGATDIVVTGTDPEWADYANPRGEIYASASYVVAEAPDGSRRISPVVKVSRDDQAALAAADALADVLNTRAQRLGRLPVGFDAWQEVQPCYGSDAYVAGSWESSQADAERLAA